jgi:predicted kinase
MKKAIITIGCSASGKSTWAIDFREDENTNGVDWVVIERDNIRKILAERKGFHNWNLWQDWKFKWEDEVDAKVTEMLNGASVDGANVIFSDTNLHQQRRNALANRLKALGYEVEYKVFGEDLSLDTLWKRDTYRKNTVGHAVIAKQYQQFRKEFPKYKLKDVTDKQNAIIFDVDGTLAKMCNRSPYDWHKVHLDEHNEILFLSMINYFECGYHIIVMSGRDSVCMEATRNWICEGLIKFGSSCGFEYDLFMRAEGDQRKDNIVKAELFMNHVDGNYKVAAVYDDRPIMCREWLEFGFDVYCVGNQYVEF